MKKQYVITTEEFDVMTKAIKNVIGSPAGCIGDKYTMEVVDELGNGTSICWDTFVDCLKREFIIKD